MFIELLASVINGYIVVGVIGLIVNFLVAIYLHRRLLKKFGATNPNIYNPSLFLLYIFIVVLFIKYLISVGEIA